MFEKRMPLQNEEEKLLVLDEDHFNDFKSKRIKPSTLQETFVSFANSDGGDIYVGIEDKKVEDERVAGFSSIEDANDIIHTLLEETEPSVENIDLEFIDFKAKGLILHISIPKSPKVHYTTQGKCFIRINARKKEIKGVRITQLSHSKGFLPYEKKIVDIAEIEDFIESNKVKKYLKRINSKQDIKIFLRKQRLLTKDGDDYKPNVGCVLLFDDEPQASLDTRCAIKVYRLLTTDTEYKREYLAKDPETINGTVEEQIFNAKKIVSELIENSTVIINGKRIKIIYPTEAIHEILVNAVIHRDYSLNDDVHIRIFDNRIEIISPGKLPGYINIENIYDERFSRNPNIVRMLHNLPNPVNHDIGEGLDTAKNELKKVGLVPPTFRETDNSLIVTIKHEKIASLEDLIMEYLTDHDYITNKMLRELSGSDDINKVKKSLQRMRKLGKIELVDKNPKSTFDYRYKLKG